MYFYHFNDFHGQLIERKRDRTAGKVLKQIFLPKLINFEVIFLKNDTKWDQDLGENYVIGRNFGFLVKKFLSKISKYHSYNFLFTKTQNSCVVRSATISLL